jgi:hypothetical protein
MNLKGLIKNALVITVLVTLSSFAWGQPKGTKAYIPMHYKFETQPVSAFVDETDRVNPINTANGNELTRTKYAITNFAGGSGTEFDPYQVETAEHLNNVRLYLGEANASVYFIQTANIDLGVSPWNEGEGWVPIGTNTSLFYGHYNGDSHVVQNMVINRSTNLYQGLFGYNNGAISNLGVVDASVTDNGSRAGILVGINWDLGSITGCFSSGIIQTTSIDGRIGGLVGWNNFVITDSYSTATIISEGIVNGGLTGANSGSNAIIINCYASGMVSGGDKTGGLTGNNQTGALIKKSYATGNVTSSGVSAGGLSGSTYDASIENSYATGTVYGNYNVGGFVGTLTNGFVTNCYSSGFVSSPNGCGGLIGAQFTITKGVINSFWDIESSGQYGSPEVGGRSIEEMITQITFTDWDFSEIWMINEGTTYPYLKWQLTPGSFNYPPALSPPKNLTVSSNELAVNLTWNPPTNGIPEKYNIYRDGVLLTDVTGQTSYNDYSVVNYTFYSYYVTAVSGIDESVPSYTEEIYFFPGFDGGDGTEGNPYLISSAEQLNAIRYYYSSFFLQVNDIDLSVSPWNEGEGWVPIDLFVGNYNGQNHIINGLFINRPEAEEYQGLFSTGGNAVLFDINLQNVNITGSNDVGALIGSSHNTTILKCTSSGSVYASGNSAGGLAGGIYSFSLISNCTSTVNVNGYDECGGLCGKAYHSAISNSSSSGTVNGNARIGGLIGRIEYSTIEGSYSTGSVSGNNNIGGLVGSASYSSEIVNSYSTADVTGQFFVGGLVGSLQQLSTINFCYSTGATTSLGNAGGLVGYVDDINTIYRSYWNTQTSGLQTSAGGTGLSTIQMVKQENFEGWDFSDIWSIEEDVTYPYLQWQGAPGDHNYAPNKTLSININGSGSIEVNGENYTQPINAILGATLNLEAIASEGWQFDGWTGDLVSPIATQVVVMNSNMAINATFSEITGIDEQASIELQLFPNPFSTLINIKSSDVIEKVTITNLQGQELMVVKLADFKQSIINTESLTNGIYLITLHHKNGDKTIRKMVKI